MILVELILRVAPFSLAEWLFIHRAGIEYCLGVVVIAGCVAVGVALPFM